MDPIRDAMDEGNYEAARDMAIARVRASPDDDNAIRLLLEVERRAVQEQRRRLEEDGDDTLSGGVPQRWRRRIDHRLIAIVAVVFLVTSGWCMRRE